MEIQLTDLPQVCLEEIFKKLNFAEISRLGATCKYFREIVKTIFRLYFKNIEEVIETEMEKIEAEANKLENLTVSEHLYLAFLHSILRIILAEAKMLIAHCWRYMKEPTRNFCCPAGIILDEFERILKKVRNRTLKKDMEPEIAITLFHLGETFYNYFDSKIESFFHETANVNVKITSKTNKQTIFPNIYNVVNNHTKETLLREISGYMKKYQGYDAEKICDNEQSSTKGTETVAKNIEYDVEEDENEKTPFGVKVLDILNCCASTNVYTLLIHNNEKDGFRLTTDYELRDINVLEALPTIGLTLTNSEKQLNKICKYIRNNVRWTNLFHPLQDLWMLEDATEINKDINTASALLRQWKLKRSSSRLKLDSIVNNVCQYDYKKVMNQFKNRFGLLINATLECPTLNKLPLKIQKCFETKCIKCKIQNFMNSNQNSEKLPNNFTNSKLIHQTDINDWDGNSSIYKFHLELKVQYPSFLSETVREAVLRVEQIGKQTIVTTDGDDMRKSATCRIDEESNI